MEAVIDASAILDYIEFRIFPSLNRYEAWVYGAGKKENVMSGLLEHLLLHSTEAKSLHSKGSNSKFVVSSPKRMQNIKWFTKSTLMRFLQIIGSPSMLNATKSLKNEINQLEETRKFHLSLYTKGAYQSKNEESGSGHSDGLGMPQNAEGSDSSKNELLQAMVLRLSALRGELIAAFEQAICSRFCMEDMIDLEKFSKNFGSAELSGSLLKYIELKQGAEGRSSETRKVGVEEECSLADIDSSSSELQEESAKAELVARRSPSDSEKSSVSSEEEQPSVGRSRSLARSFSPRRSASPMRRVQIGRSGSRRSTALTIKSLNYFPARDKTFMTKDAGSDSGDERSEGPAQKSESNVKRMSVQDAIHLFESKQKDQTVDTHKGKSSGTFSSGPNRVVLRRWSSGTAEEASCSHDSIAESIKRDGETNVGGEERTSGTPGTECIPVVSEDKLIDCSSDMKLNSTERACLSDDLREESGPAESNGISDKLLASSQWSLQKEAELNELMMQMKESKHVKKRTVASTKRAGVQTQHRGASSDHCKEKKDEKIQGSATKSVTDKNKPFKAVQKVVETKKSKAASAITSEAGTGRKPNQKTVQRQQKNVVEPANKNGSAQAGVVKKAAPKASSLPTTRKSWPVSSDRVAGVPPAKAPGSASSMSKIPTRKRSQTTPFVTQTPKVEVSPAQAKSVKSDQIGDKKSSRSVSGKKQQSVSKPGKMAESTPETSSDKLAPHPKPRLYSKVTKKSTVVPLESKSISRKGSGTLSAAAINKESSSGSQEPLRKSDDLSMDKSINFTSSSELVIQKEEEPDAELDIDAIKESCSSVISHQEFSREDSGQAEPISGDSMHRVAEELNTETDEEHTISPTAWVEIEEPENISNTSAVHISPAVDSPASLARVGVFSPHIRHSLSQMLIDETTEHDVVDWGNAPQPVVSHKDAPKGLKRLLKFARKSKTDANSTGRSSSPSVFSEGEEDLEDSRSVNKTKKGLPENSGHQKSAASYDKSAQATKSKFSSQTQEGNVSVSVTRTKARSFFSLSAFKSSK